MRFDFNKPAAAAHEATEDMFANPFGAGAGGAGNTGYSQGGRGGYGGHDDSDDRPQEFLWANAGAPMTYVDEETGETETVFVNLPIGIPLGTMKPVKVGGTSKKMRWLRTMQNQLIQQAAEYCTKKAGPGETVDLPMLQLQARFVANGATKEETATGIDQVASLFAAE